MAELQDALALCAGDGGEVLAARFAKFVRDEPGDRTKVLLRTFLKQHYSHLGMPRREPMTWRMVRAAMRVLSQAETFETCFPIVAPYLTDDESQMQEVALYELFQVFPSAMCEPVLDLLRQEANAMEYMHSEKNVGLVKVLYKIEAIARWGECPGTIAKAIVLVQQIQKGAEGHPGTRDVLADCIRGLEARLQKLSPAKDGRMNRGGTP